MNGAQRIQTEAEPGQIVVSEDVWRRLRNRPAFVFESLGERELKGIERMELFRSVAIEIREESDSAAVGTRRQTKGTEIPPDTARSVAVLPFTNMSPNADNEYFSDGVTPCAPIRASTGSCGSSVWTDHLAGGEFVG